MTFYSHHSHALCSSSGTAATALQVLRNRLDTARGDWRLEAKGGDAERGRRDRQLQETESDHVRMGDPRSAVGGQDL